MYIHINIHMYIHIHIHIHVHIYIHIHIYMYINIHVYMYIYVHIHIYIYTYIYHRCDAMEARDGYDSRKSPFSADLCSRFRFRIVEYENTQLQNVKTVGEMEVSLQEIRSGFEFVPGLFGIVWREGICTVRGHAPYKF